jgi:hypothetical protein
MQRSGGTAAAIMRIVDRWRRGSSVSDRADISAIGWCKETLATTELPGNDRGARRRTMPRPPTVSVRAVYKSRASRNPTW